MEVMRPGDQIWKQCKSNSILTDNANRAFQGNVAVQVTQPGGELWNQAMQVTSPDDQILNQFAINQKY